ncbi:MAG: oxygen-dependent coproporphyrinogen oxidase [Verrucomicrobia bacterium]|nr:oxygen-dependent coproporphyrinogen oxidase [Verrucomicrobiota bacterium]
MHTAESFKTQLLNLQQTIVSGLQALDDSLIVTRDPWHREDGGGGISIAMTGQAIEKGGVNFSDIEGNHLPPSATLKRPQLQGRPFRAMGVSVVMHPANPYAPTSHMNVRLFTTIDNCAEPIWWFGGGFDLTPFYPFDEDIVLWHQSAFDACASSGRPDLYPIWKQQCDTYFYLPHRSETRGVGGLFFDDFCEGGFERAMALTLEVGHTYWKAYRSILSKRMHSPFTERERSFQLYRRGRYVEFNLLHDRGTLFGIQSKGRTESILMSLPPLVRWEYGFNPDPQSPEAKLTEYLKPRTWL